MSDSSLSRSDERIEQRQRVRLIRQSVTKPQKTRAELLLTRRLWRLGQTQRAQHISIYLAVDEEISLEGFMNRAARRN